MAKRGSKTKALFDLMRPINCVMAGIATILAIFIALEGDLDIFLDSEVALFQGFIIAFFFAFAGNALNDYFDRNVDKLNHPERPIPRGDLRPSTARNIALILFLLLTVWSWFITQWAFIIVSTSAVLMISYEVKLKGIGLPGNITISWLTGCAFLFGGSVVGRMPTVLLLALLAALASIGREIIKDVEDMEGDKDRHTLPMRIGKRSASKIAAVGFFCAVLLSPLPFIWDMMGYAYLFTVVAADVMFIYCAVMGFSSPSRSQKFAKLGMLFGLIAFFVGTLVQM